jgi:hypothetical protein
MTNDLADTILPKGMYSLGGVLFRIDNPNTATALCVQNYHTKQPMSIMQELHLPKVWSSFKKAFFDLRNRRFVCGIGG